MESSLGHLFADPVRININHITVLNDQEPKPDHFAPFQSEIRSSFAFFGAGKNSAP